jgi:hypothetical protein
MQTCLEKRGIPARASALTRNDYSTNDQYSNTHPDALSNGDPQGKGTGSGGHTHSVPNCDLPSTMIDYSNFDTENGGGQYDIEGRNEIGGRNRLMTINIYNRENQYGPALVDTSLNVADGQVVI